MIGALRPHQQVRLGIGTHELRVAGVGHRGGTALGGDGNVVLLLELVQVLLLQVDLARCLCTGRDERQDDGGGKAVETALIHWRVPLTLIGWRPPEAAAWRTGTNFPLGRPETSPVDHSASRKSPQEAEPNPKRCSSVRGVG